jgi:multidrug transporter EmrE-like cation transporter
VIASIGILFFREPVGVLKLIGLAAIIAGVITLNLSGAAH